MGAATKTVSPDIPKNQELGWKSWGDNESSSFMEILSDQFFSFSDHLDAIFWYLSPKIEIYFIFLMKFFCESKEWCYIAKDEICDNILSYLTLIFASCSDQNYTSGDFYGIPPSWVRSIWLDNSYHWARKTNNKFSGPLIHTLHVASIKTWLFESGRHYRNQPRWWNRINFTCLKEKGFILSFWITKQGPVKEPTLDGAKYKHKASQHGKLQRDLLFGQSFLLVTKLVWVTFYRTLTSAL